MTDPTLVAEEVQVETIRENGTEIAVVDAGVVQGSLNAFIGSTETDDRSDGQMSRNVTSTTTIDFIVPTADLPTEVERAMEILISGQRYRAVSQSGESPGVPSRHGLLTRIHTVRVK